MRVQLAQKMRFSPKEVDLVHLISSSLIIVLNQKEELMFEDKTKII